MKAQTIRGYHYLEPRIYKAIGHLRIDKITPRHVQKFINELSEENRRDALGAKGQKLSAKTVKLHLSLISTVFDYAVKMDMLYDNLCRRVTIPNGEAKEKNIYSIEELEQLMALLETAHLKYRLFFTMVLYTGFRRSKILGLEWKDIDWDNRVISIRRTSNYTAERGTYATC